MSNTKPVACDVLAARIRINHALEVRVLTQSFNGRCFLHVREFMLGDDNEFWPTKKGISVPLEQLELILDSVRELIDEPNHTGVVAVVPHGVREEIRFSVAEWKGTRKADIRTFFKPRDGQEYQPGKGLRINLALLPEIERALEELERSD